MAFIESPRFPDDISRGATGGPAWNTEVVVTSSGWEQRNIRWANARHTYNAAYGIRDIDKLEAIIHYFATARGRAHGFRFKDWGDYKSGSVTLPHQGSDQVIGTGDGAQTVFQLTKKYDVAGIPWLREIKKPVQDTVLVQVDANPVVPAHIDYTTGEVTITPAPAPGLVVTAGYEFDTPVRFDTDTLINDIEVYNLGSTAIPLVEIRL